MNWLRAYLRVPFTLLAFFVRIFYSNRDWMRERLSGEKIAFWIKVFMVVTVLIWFVIWLYTNPSERGGKLPWPFSEI